VNETTKNKPAKRRSEQQAWPYRWDRLLRYRMIEIIALWEGRLTSNHLQKAFGIGRQQASKDINEYKNVIGPKNLEFDSKLKGYVPSTQFTPILTKGEINEYLHMLNSQSDLLTHFENLDLPKTHTEVVTPLFRAVKANIVRPIIVASRENQRIEIEYSSLTSDKDYRNIVPHTLVFNGYRWHVRAFCEKSQEYRDFVLSRITNIYDFVGQSEQTVEFDKAWNTKVGITIKPDSRLSTAQQAVIEADYGMLNGVLKLETRGAMVEYLLQFLRINTKELKADPKAQQVVIENKLKLKKWLFE
jgi:predicted DNA-binding transcriptional regulator YafY